MKRKLFFAVLCIASALSFAAEVQWTGNTVGDGTYYLYNVGADKFLNIGNKSNDNWGANANLSTNSTFDFTLAYVSDGVYTIDSKVSNGGDNHFVNSSTWCDGAATNWTFRAVDGETNVYQIIFDGQYFMATEGLDDVEMVGDPGSRTTSTYWKLVTKADRIAALSSATEASPLDATFLITAPNFGRNDQRNSTWQGNPSIGGADNTASCNFNAEKFGTTYDVYQTISNVPNGWYKLYVQGYYRDGGYVAAASAYNAGTENLYAKYYINDVSAPLMSIFDDSGKTGNSNQTTEGITGKFPDDRAGEMSAFNAGLYENIPLIVNVTDGNIRVGVKAETLTADAWTGFDNFRLEYLGTSEPQVQSYVKIKNPQPFVHSKGWTVSVTPNAFDATNACAEFWNQNGATMTQTLASLPAGYYTLTAVALTRTDYTAVLSANDKSMNIATVSSSVVNTRAQANTWFNAGNGVNNLTFRHAEAGDITIGLKAATQGNYWTVWRSFELKYLGEYPMSVTQQVLADAVAEAEGLYTFLPTAAKAALKGVVDAKNTTYSTGKEYNDAADAVKDAITNARPFIDPYARFKTVKANVVALKDQTTKYTDPGTAVSTFDAAVAAQQKAVDEATTAAAIETAIVNLRKAASAFAGNVDIVAGQYLDMTDAMLYNASMRNSGDLSLWTIVSNTNASYPKYANNCSEFWGANFDFYQTAYELPAGNYNIEVSAFHRAAQEGSTYHTFLYANSDQVLVLPLANGENNTAQAEASFNAGLYTNSIKVTLANAIDVNIGFKNEDTADDKRENGAATDKWTIFRDFKIKYFGDDALALYRDEYEGALTAATEALADATYTNVGGTDRSNLSTAVNTTYPTSVVEVDETQEKFETATSNLTALTTTFKNGVASWNNYTNTRAGVATAKAEADLFDEDIYTGLGLTEPTTAAEAAAKAAGDEPAVRVATAQYVATKYTYSLTSKIGDFSTWTPTATVNGQPATAQTLDGEHWSNTTRTYYEQANTGWSSNAWTVQYQKVANNLPAGNYVLKLAARGSVDTHGTIASSATANTVTLPSAGNNTRGITTSGAASWSDSDTFRKSAGASTEDNKGAGWQWRFLPFTVSEAGDVTLTIEAQTDLIYNWVSLADAELLSDEDKTTKITLSDASDMASTIASNDGELATVTLQRGIKVGYNTVVLPFDLTAVQVQAVFGTGAVVYSYSENSADVSSAELSFTTVGAGTITANVPVLVKATSAANEKVIEGVTIEAPTTPAVEEGKNFDYVGVYDNTTFAEGDYFMATKDDVQKIFESNGTDTAKPFRAYFQKRVAAPVKATLLIDGVATSISEINGDNNDAAAKIFNLAGQRVQKAQKGIYIVNGKKVVIK